VSTRNLRHHRTGNEGLFENASLLVHRPTPPAADAVDYLDPAQPLRLKRRVPPLRLKRRVKPRHRTIPKSEIASLNPQTPIRKVRSKRRLRLFVEAVLWIVRTGSPWRDLPAHFGNWSTAFTRFRDWVRADVWARLFEAVSDEPDMEYAMVDATIVKVHRHGQGAKGGLKARPSAAPRAA
jgi:transposase